jgi:hypothetical protein
LRWLETVALPGTSLESIDHQHLLRAMDALVDHKAEVDNVMASLLRPLVDQDLAMVFYDMTTIRAAGLSEQEGDLRRYGMAKEGVVARQVMLGVVQTAEGFPWCQSLRCFDHLQRDVKKKGRWPLQILRGPLSKMYL